MERLCTANLPALPASVAQPTYDRAGIRPGIVHLGLGAFHRAHMAVYIQRLLAREPQWAIVGASLRHADVKDALTPQDGLYTVAVRDAGGTRCEVIGSIIGILDGRRERARLLDLMAHPVIGIVSLTITEKGYCHDPATGELDERHPDIVHDLEDPESPNSAPGLIVAAIERRRRAGVPPVAVMSCDNLPSNGKTTARIVTRLAELRSRELAEYIRGNVAFPSTMVDRIVPATTAADRQLVAQAIGLEDAWPVMTEPFTQWVIEDNFPQGRPSFHAVGAEMVSDVEPYERMKLRMLNGSHSTLAYLGYLAGYDYVSEAIAAPGFGPLIKGLMSEEVIPTLNMPGVDLARYRDDLLSRFANPALQHRTQQIAMDGTQKLPQRLLNTIRDRLATGRSITRLSLGVAAWMRYVTGVDEKGQPIEVKDPLAERLRKIADRSQNEPIRLTVALMTLREVFGTDLPQSEVFRETVTAHLASLFQRGAAETVAALVRATG
ncbi:MAG: mannitol dehydrogenase family protein [Devosia sp.]|jgi:fructuronate reductase|nr:mannitol dehydrogenase family protein [Devosiaceae bacterium]